MVQVMNEAHGSREIIYRKMSQSFSRRHLIVESIHTYKEARLAAAADFFSFATTAIQSARNCIC